MRLTPKLRVCGAAVVLACALGVSHAAAPKDEQLELQPPKPLVPTAFFPKWTFDAPQFVQANRKGEVFLFRADTLEVFPFGKGRIGPPGRLEKAGAAGVSVSDVAMSADGSVWVIAADNRILVFKDGEQQPAPDVGWLVTSVAVLRGSPLAGVLPMKVGPGVGRRPSSPPLVV
jgi:hypothetical protein